MFNNPRITKKERGLLKGAIRRVFARSELRQRVLDASEVQHSDPLRPRVKRWNACNECKKPEARSYMVIDHKDPVIPINSSFEELGVETTVNRTWCDENNLQSLCPECHDSKSKRENKERTRIKKERRIKNESKTT